jgi:hypothetical protein
LAHQYVARLVRLDGQRFRESSERQFDGVSEQGERRKVSLQRAHHRAP